MPNEKYYHAFRDREGGLSALWPIPLVDGNRHLFEFDVTPDGKPRVIAHPAAAHPDPAVRLDLTEPASHDEGRVTVRAEQVADPRVTRFLSSLGSNLSGIPSTLHPVRVELHDQTYAGGFRHLGREGGPDWIICMLLPENEVFGDVRRMARFMVLLGLDGVLVAGALSALLSRRVSASLGGYRTRNARDWSVPARCEATRAKPHPGDQHVSNVDRRNEDRPALVPEICASRPGQASPRVRRRGRIGWDAERAHGLFL